MSIFSDQNQNTYFNQAKWEREASFEPNLESNLEGAPISHEGDSQFVLLQLADGDKRILSTSEINPKLQGNSEKEDINLQLAFESFKIGSNEDIDRNTKATLQLQIGQEKNYGALEKLFYCINGGLDLYNEVKGKKAEPKSFSKNTSKALGNQPISLPGGVGKLTLKVVKHQKPKWWQKVFSFAQSDTGRELFSLIGFPGITEAAINSVSSMLDGLFDKQPDVLFQSQPVKLCFTQAAREELSGGLSTNLVSSLNPGFWVMARKSDYNMIMQLKPIYYGGFGTLAPDGMNEMDALQDSSNNPFSKITYAIIRAKMKEVDLSQISSI